MKTVLLIAFAIFILYAARTNWFSAPAPGSVASTLISPLETGPVVAAKRDLANRLSVSPEAVSTVLVTPRTWSDTCLGVPEPGEGCSRTTIEGFEIHLGAQGAAYVYRTDATGGGLRRVAG